MRFVTYWLKKEVDICRKMSLSNSHLNIIYLPLITKLEIFKYQFFCNFAFILFISKVLFNAE